MDASYRYNAWKPMCPNNCPYPEPHPAPCNPPQKCPQKSLAMAYVPWQSWGNLYSPMEALANGTLFGELNLIFTGRGCKK